ncbi:hypothetical protein GCM10027615_22860 [Plantactinospora veratri]
MTSGQLAREPGGAVGSGRAAGTDTVRPAAEIVPGRVELSPLVFGRGVIGVGRRSLRALLMAAVVRVARKGSPASAGGIDPRCVGGIGVIPGGGGGGAETGRFAIVSAW